MAVGRTKSGAILKPALACLTKTSGALTSSRPERVSSEPSVSLGELGSAGWLLSRLATRRHKNGVLRKILAPPKGEEEYGTRISPAKGQPAIWSMGLKLVSANRCCGLSIWRGRLAYHAVAMDLLCRTDRSLRCRVHASLY